MKSTPLLAISLAMGLSLAACRTERKSTASPPRHPKETAAISGPPAASSIQPDEAPPAVNPENLEKPPSTLKSSEPTAEEQLLRMRELERAEVFDVPISDQAALDRAEAWPKLTSEVPHEILKKDQYLYARDLLDRYGEAPVLERLVFWRLVDLRLHMQRVSSIARVAGDDYRDLRLSMNPQLKAILYSALGDDPEKLPDFLAARKAMKILQAASPNKSPLEY